MVTYDRWFLTPATTIELLGLTDNVVHTFRGPKYSDDDRITGYSGNTTTPSVVTDHYPALTQTFPDVDTWYIVRMYGEDNPGWNALNEIHNYQDTRTLADHANDVVPVLEQNFPDLDLTADQWANAFKVG